METTSVNMAIPGSGKGFVSSQERPDWLWDPPGLQYEPKRGPLSRKIKRQVRETDHTDI
jgi:hypothetical protein